MSRPKPTILMTDTNSKSFKVVQVLEAESIYAVFHKGKPINMRILNQISDIPGPKYKKCSFSNPRSCI